ncbi:MAG TPA: hypothetical protein VGM98_02745, partial [Schlesneria sp.]|jgi:hypothetical protein
MAAGALLLVSLALFGMEMRSRVMHDALAFTDDARHQRLIVSMKDTVTVFYWKIPDDEHGADLFESIPSGNINFFMADIEYMRSRPNFSEVRIPYWCLILPPTLIVGGLLFWKPRAIPR